MWAYDTALEAQDAVPCKVARMFEAVIDVDTFNEPVIFEFPCEKYPFLMTNSLGILYLFPIQD